ncbi:MAG: MoxR family ATPase [Acidimicrobiia bacterium]|nr:MoxR family ATPase [Acidimicrobiia bacterium]NNF65442.1 MoxR family ATPase [Acidimicrobiia bacterium]
MQPALRPTVPSPQLAIDIFANVSSVIKGKRDELRLAVAVVLAGGHLLVEDVPGVGKTLLARSLARSVDGSFGRVQGTPDLLPADVTGVSVYRKGTETWDFKAGPLFANVVLFDEINRSTPRTQSALLEAMEERTATVDGITYAMPSPFVVIATQNPQEHHGTFPLVEGQRDRFAAVLGLGLPPLEIERALLLGTGGTASLAELRPVVAPEQLAVAIEDVAQVRCDPRAIDYLLALVAALRDHPDVQLGPSPRASLAFLAVARGYATVNAREYVTPDDVKAVASAVLAHRLVLSQGDDLNDASRLVDEVTSTVPVP